MASSANPISKSTIQVAINRATNSQWPRADRTGATNGLVAMERAVGDRKATTTEVKDAAAQCAAHKCRVRSRRTTVVPVVASPGHVVAHCALS